LNKKNFKELYFNSYFVATQLTIPQKENIVIRPLSVKGVTEEHEEIELTKIAESDLTLDDYLDLEARLVKTIFVTLTDIFHGTPRLRKYVYKVPPSITEIIEVIEVRRENNEEKITRYKLVYNITTIINLVKVIRLN